MAPLRAPGPCLLILLGLSLSAPVRAQPRPEPAPAGFAGSFDDLFDEGLARFKERDFAAAIPLLERALRIAPDDIETLLLLGIACYRHRDLARAEPLLLRVSRQGDAEEQAEARAFLGLTRKARRQDFPLLTGTLVVSPEFDGNVPLTDLAAWMRDPGASADGDLLLVGTLSLRPWRGVGLYLSDTLAYRQQLRLQDYDLLLNNTTLGYNYLGERHRLKISGGFTYAMLGGSTLDYDGFGKISYRVALWSRLGLGASYEGHYRDYRQAAYAPFTGQTHSAAVELSWGVTPAPITIAFGYQGIREQLMPVSTTLSDGTVYVDDFRAWAHGPQLRLRAALGKRVELALLTAALSRTFDYVDPQRGRRLDWYVLSDLSLNVACTRWLDAFTGALLIYNSSTDPLFSYLKPGAYAGLSGSFSAL